MFSSLFSGVPIEIIGAIIGSVTTIFVGVGGWILVAGLNKANIEKVREEAKTAKAETEKTYQSMAYAAADREKELSDRIDEQNKKIEELVKASVEKDKKIEDLNNKVNELNKAIVFKDEQIAEMKKLSGEQANKIVRLENELHAFKLVKSVTE